MTAPDFLPVLSGGAHDDPSKGACVMEYVSMLAGEEFTDRPTCTHPILAAAARVVNDTLPDGKRFMLVPLIGRLFGTGDVSDVRLSVGLAQWCAANAATNATNAEAAAYAATNATNANAAGYAASASAAGVVTFLTKLIDEYDRLTGRTEHADFAEELPKVSELVGTNG